ncbi:LysR family transcriptional regulator [Salinisphaera shabanensis T35B1]|uniref:LysR family transcriptional regulator n=1 Tax=Salinisphaera shabanensis TaxID=180542 RepID=UPI00333E71DA
MTNETRLSTANWNDLKYFLAVARHRRLTRAAQVFATSRVTVGNRIRALETALDTQLFVQTGDGFMLTEAGNRLFRYAESVEGNLRLGLEVLGLPGATRSRVRLGVTEGLGDNYLSRRIAGWVPENSIQIDFISLPKSTTVTSREADISITLEQPVGEFVIRRLLTDYTLSVYATPEYLARHKPIRHRQQLVDHAWIGYIENMMFTGELKYHHEIASTLNFVFQSTTIGAQKEAALAGVGLSILPDYMAADDARLVRVLDDVQFVRHYWISTNRDLHRFAAVNKTWHFILNQVRGDRRLLYSVSE